MKLRSKEALKKQFGAKLTDSFRAVLPIFAVVMLLSLSFVPMPAGIVLSFIFGSFMLVIGMMLFSLGSEMSMTKIGEQVGALMTKSKKLPLIIFVSFLTGFIVTVAEPDLQVLAKQVPNVSASVLTLSVSCGVGLFLVIAVLRMLFGIPLSKILLAVYPLVFLLAFFVPRSFLSVAFDSGGVTTGPMTVPFIMAFGIGISEIRSDRHATEDSFGLVALCSVGPILAVMLLGMIGSAESVSAEAAAIDEITVSSEITRIFVNEMPAYGKEITVSLLPIAVFYAGFRLLFLKNVSRRTTIRIKTESFTPSSAL